MFSGGLFLVGSFPSVVPFLLIDTATTALIWATALSLLGLFIVGVVKARVAKSGWVRSGMENLVIAGIGGVIAYVVGDIVGAALI
jgi:predicted membrane protein (TIGR00267 family)